MAGILDDKTKLELLEKYKDKFPMLNDSRAFDESSRNMVLNRLAKGDTEAAENAYFKKQVQVGSEFADKSSEAVGYAGALVSGAGLVKEGFGALVSKSSDIIKGGKALYEGSKGFNLTGKLKSAISMAKESSAGVLDKGVSLYNKAGSAVEKTLEGTKSKFGEYVGGFKGKLQSGLSNIKESVVNKASGLIDDGSSALSRMKDKTVDVFKGAKESVVNKAESALEYGKKIKDDVGAFGSKIGEKIKGKISGFGDDLAEGGSKLLEKGKSFVKAPLQKGFQALKKAGAAFGLGSLFGGGGGGESEEDTGQSNAPKGTVAPLSTAPNPSTLHADIAAPIESAGIGPSVDSGAVAAATGGLDGDDAKGVLTKIYDILVRIHRNTEKISADTSNLVRSASTKDISNDLAAAQMQGLRTEGSENKSSFGAGIGSWFKGSQDNTSGKKTGILEKAGDYLRKGALAAAVAGGAYSGYAKADDERTGEEGGFTKKVKGFFSPVTDFLGITDSEDKKYSPNLGGDLKEGENLEKQILSKSSKARENDLMMGSVDKQGKYSPYIVDKSLGSLSAKFESAGKGTSAIGYDATGGTSYGTYQIASKINPKSGKSTMDAFIEHLEKTGKGDVAQQLREAGPADSGGKGGNFVNVWQDLRKSGKLTHEDEHGFIKKTHYDPAIKKAQELGYDVSNPMIQNMVWSGSVQHGGINKVLQNAIKGKDISKMSTEEQIKAFYDYRKEYSKKSGYNLDKRYNEEMELALKNVNTPITPAENAKNVSELSQTNNNITNSATNISTLKENISDISNISSSKDSTSNNIKQLSEVKKSSIDSTTNQAKVSPIPNKNVRYTGKTDVVDDIASGLSQTKDYVKDKLSNIAIPRLSDATNMVSGLYNSATNNVSNLFSNKTDKSTSITPAIQPAPQVASNQNTAVKSHSKSTPAPVTQPDTKSTGISIMSVRNDEPTILTLQYGNIRTV